MQLSAAKSNVDPTYWISVAILDPKYGLNKEEFGRRFSKQNIDRLINNLKANETPLYGPSPNNPDFSCFVNTFNGEIDKACKLEKPKTTKRNAINNPWITDAIIESVNHKKKLYENWKKTCKLKKTDGDRKLHAEFSEYRKHLKKIIKFAKSNYYNSKI